MKKFKMREKYMEDKEFKLKEKEKKSNNRVAWILVASVFIVLGIGIAYNIDKNSLDPEYEALEKKYNESNNKVTNLENDLSEAKNKLTQAEPWFELSSEKQNEIKEELKKAEQERTAKEEAERKAEEEEEARKQQEAEEAKKKEENEIYNTGITYNQLVNQQSSCLYEKVTFSGRVVGVVNDTGYDSEENLIKLAVNGDSNKILHVRQISLRNSIGIAVNSNITVRGIYEGIDGGYPSIISEDRDIDR
jgi:cytoskeletal protein RodZ